MLKTVVEKFSFNEFNIEKVKFFIQSPTKIYCISIFSKLLNFQTIFNVRLLAIWLFVKNTYTVQLFAYIFKFKQYIFAFMYQVV